MSYNEAYLLYLEYGFWPQAYLQQVIYPYPVRVWPYLPEIRRYPW